MPIEEMRCDEAQGDARRSSLGKAGFELVRQGRIEEAVTVFRQGVSLDPGDPAPHLDLGVALRLAGQREEAIRSLGQALALAPDWPMALYNLGTVLLESGDPRGALAAFQKTVDLRPDWNLAQGGLGMALLQVHEVERATAALERSFALDPGFHPASHFLGAAQMASGQTGAAIETYREGLRHHREGCPTCHLSLGFTLLREGEYSEGWGEYEWRWPCQGHTPAIAGLGPAWDGSPLEGKTIALWSEQGLGDILHFVRFAALVHERGGVVHVLTRPCLDRLLATCPGVARVALRAEDLGEVDCQLPLASLPRVLGISLADLPAAPIPYLTPPEPLCRDPFGPRRHGVRRVGLVWAVEPGQPTWQERSCPLPLFRALAEVPGIELYSLQFGSRASELRQPGAPPAADLSAVLGDFASTAAFLEHLDLVITVDTSMAHLAGALGRPVWTLLHQKSDWRWLREREDTPWYPTMRLFRQREHGAWEPVIERVAAALREELYLPSSRQEEDPFQTSRRRTRRL